MRRPTRLLTALAVPLLALAMVRPGAAFELLVTNRGTDEVLRFDGVTGAPLGVFADVTEPQSIAADGEGLVYVVQADGVVRQYDETGDLLDFLVSGLGSPGNCTVGPDGRLYISDFFGDVVWVAEFDGAPSLVGAFVTAGSGGVNGPTGLTFGPGGDLFVSSRISGQVIRYDGDTGTPAGVFATPGGNGPQGLTFGGPNGDLFVASDDTNTVMRFDRDTGAALGTFADPIGTSTDGMKPIFGPDGRLYVLLTVGNGQIERFDGTTGASQGVFIAGDAAGFDEAYDFAIVPEPAAPGSVAIVALALLAVRARRR